LNKRALGLLLLFVVIIGVVVYFYVRPQQPALTVQRIYEATTVGETFLVNVSVSNVKALAQWSLDLTWNPQIVRITTGGPNFTMPAMGGPSVGLFEGPFLRSAGQTIFIVNFVDHELGETILGAVAASAGESGATGSGVILVMNFTVVKVGTTTIEMNPPFPSMTNQSVLMSLQNEVISHTESNGLVTENGPPAIWASTDFQLSLIGGEVAVLALATGIVYWRTHPRPPKSARRRAELQPVIDAEDQVDSD
jgi:hypothetical protein